MKAIITVGVSASGKTTWAKAHAQVTGALISNRDDLRFSMTGADDWTQYTFHHKLEKAISGMQDLQARSAALMGRDFILSDTNLSRGKNAIWVQMLQGLGYEVEIKMFDISLEEAIARDKARAKSVGEKIIRMQYNAYLTYKGV